MGRKLSGESGPSGSGRSSIGSPIARRRLFDLVLAQVIPLASSIITTFATAAILGVSGRGVLAFVLSSSSLVGALGFLSLQVGIVRAVEAGDTSAVRRGFGVGFGIAAFVFAIGTGIALISPEFRFGLFDRQTVLMVSIGGALVIVNLVVLRTCQGVGESRLFRNAWLVQAAVYPMLGVPCAIATRSPILVSGCWYVALLASTTYAMAKRARPSSRLPGHAPQVPISEIVSSSLAGHAGVMGQQLLHSGDIVVLGLFGSASAVGAYSVAVPIAGLVWIFSEALSLLAFDSGGKSVPSLKAHERRSGYIRLNFIVGTGGAIVIAAGTMVLLPVMLPQYSAAVVLVLILLPGVLIQGAARIALSSILTSASKRVLVFVGLASALLSTLYVPLVINWSSFGAAIGSSLIYCLQTAVVFIVIRRTSSTEYEAASYFQGDGAVDDE